MKQLLVIIGMLLTACGTGPTQSHGGPVQDQVSLIDTLRKDLAVDVTGSIAQPFLHPESGTTVRLSGESLAGPADIQLFEYRSAAAASAEAKGIRRDGSGTANASVDWVAPPHFFLKGRVLAIYVGKDRAVMTLLARAMGPQFAGSSQG